MRIIDRFLQYIEHKGISENKATIDCGLSQGLLHQAKSGKSDLGPDEKRKLLFASDDLSVTVYGGRNAWGALHETIYRKQRFVAELE
jgi:hypothetical protein